MGIDIEALFYRPEVLIEPVEDLADHAAEAALHAGAHRAREHVAVADTPSPIAAA